MERKSIEETPGILYWEIGLACARDEAALDMRQGSATAMGYNETYQATVRSHFETNGGETKIWHALSLVDKNEPTKFRLCKICEDGRALYLDSRKSPMLREMSMKDYGDFAAMLFMILQLEKVDWLPQEQIGEAESELPRFNL